MLGTTCPFIPIVRDHDEAIAWFTQVPGFTLVTDQPQPEQHKRRVLLAPLATSPA